MDEKEREKEKLFDKAISFFNESLYYMAIYYLNPSKTINNEDIVDEYIKKCEEHIKEQHAPENQKQFMNPKDRLDFESTVNRVLKSENNYEILGLSNNANREQVLEAYKKLIISYHPDVNSSPNAEEIFNKISKAYTSITHNKETNPYKLLIQTFRDQDLVEVIKTEKSDMDYKQLSLSPILKCTGFLFQGSIYFIIFIYFVLPYFYSGESSSTLYDFIVSESNPFEKTTRRLKVKYYIGNDFKEKYSSNRDIRNIEKEIEYKYLEYLNKTCEETKETKEKYTKRLIYYKRGTLNYNSIINDIAKVDLTVCDNYEKYNKRYETMKQKLEQLENMNEENEEQDNSENKENEGEKEKEKKKE